MAQGQIDHLCFLGTFQRLTYLPQNFIFANNHRVESAGDAEQVLNRGLTLKNVGIAAHSGIRDIQMSLQEIEARRPGMAIFTGHGIDFSAITGGQYYPLGGIGA